MALTALPRPSMIAASTNGNESIPPSDRRTTNRRSTNRVSTLPIAVHIDDQEATIVNLSDTGAQVVSTTRFRPNQKVRVFLPDDKGLIRCHAVIAWVMFEIPKKGEARYRLGIRFTDGDAKSLQSFCRRHRMP